jgi:hypothetical protein
MKDAGRGVCGEGKVLGVAHRRHCCSAASVAAVGAAAAVVSTTMRAVMMLLMAAAGAAIGASGVRIVGVAGCFERR